MFNAHFLNVIPALDLVEPWSLLPSVHGVSLFLLDVWPATFPSVLRKQSSLEKYVLQWEVMEAACFRSETM